MTYKKIFLFWVPLAATWLMMSVEGPLIAAVIARMGQAKLNLAAYGVAYAFALIIEAPIIMLLSASTALVKDRQSFRKLRNFTHILNAGITIVMLVLLIPQVLKFVLMGWMDLPREMVQLTHRALIFLLVWPAAIGYRRFYQGILIRYGFTRRVAYGTVARLVSMATTALLLYFWTTIHGAWVGAMALSAGVFFELVAVRLMSNDALRLIANGHDLLPGNEKLGYREILRFYYPLALTSILGLVVQPALTFFMGHGKFPLESLAVWPVVSSFVFIFRAVGLSYQEAAISLLGEREEYYDRIRRFATAMAAITSGLLALIAFTPLMDLWLLAVSGLNRSLADFAYLPVRILILMPAFTVWISFQRAVLVNRRYTAPVTVATFIEVLTIVLVMAMFIFRMPWAGVTIAAMAMIAGRSGSILYLQPRVLKEPKKVAENSAETK